MASAQALTRKTTSELQLLADRIEAETKFAKSLCELQKSKAGSFEKLIAQAEERVGKVFAQKSVEAVRRGVEEIEALMAPIGKVAKQYTLYCVGHAHVDMNWQWGWPETVATTHDTFMTVLKLMEEYPTFHFSQSQASMYAIVERHNPALLKRIAERVKEGRWEVVASHWVEGDHNMVSGESLTRHVLHTRRYLQKIFNLSPEDVQIDWSPDTFGHPNTLPMYLRRGGVKWMYLHRPGEIGTKRPGAFWWKAPDGSRVLVRNDMANGYNGVFNPNVADVLTNFCAETGLTFGQFVYGVGDHGGGPTRRDLEMALLMNEWPIFPNLTFSRSQDFYARLEKEGGKLPVLTCELNTEVTGCYTTQALIKRCNRIAENRLLDAETICALASATTGRAYPKEDFVEGWRDTLLGHFHDILPGSNVHDSRTYMHGLFQKTMAASSMNETLALRELAGQVKTNTWQKEEVGPDMLSARATLGAGTGYASNQGIAYQAEQTEGGKYRPFVVFNTTAWERREVVTATLWTDTHWPKITEEIKQRKFSVQMAEGEVVQAQVVEHGVYWGHGFTKVVFPVKVPAMGYTTCTVIEEASAAAKQMAKQITPPYHCAYIPLERSREGLENDLLLLELDPMTGGIRRLVDKRSGVAIIDRQGAAATLEYLVEKPHGMSSWVIDNACVRETPQVVAINRKQDGPYMASVEVRYKIHESEMTLAYEVRVGDPRLYVHLQGMWFQRGTPQTGVPCLRLGLPVAVTEAKATYEVPFGAIERDLNHDEELPALNWAMVQGQAGRGKTAGLLLANDCKHGHSLEGSTLHLTLIRSAYDPDPLPDIGQHEVHLAIVPFSGKLGTAEAIREGRNLNRPLRMVGTTLHDGKLKATGGALSVNNDDVIVSDLKQAEEGEDVIVRLLNPGGKVQNVQVKLETELLGKFAQAREVDLMEHTMAGEGVKLAGNVLSAKVPAFGMTSVRLMRK